MRSQVLTAAVALLQLAIVQLPAQAAEHMALPAVALPRPPARMVANRAQVRDWFAKYDQIRRESQMTPAEKQECHHLLADITAPTATSEDKAKAKQLLTKQIMRYSRALTQMRGLPQVAETRGLAEGYTKYFSTAGALFNDNLKIVDNLLAAGGDGRPILMGLKGRKEAVEALDAKNKALDASLRKKFGIPAYHR